MSRVERCDEVIWFSHIEEGEALIQRLDNLVPEEDVWLSVNGVIGLWARMRDQKDDPGRPTRGIKPVGDARVAWRSIPKGEFVDIIEVPDALEPARPGPQTAGTELVFEVAAPRVQMIPVLANQARDGDSLCMGIDFAWWGGSRRDPSSRTDTIAYAVIHHDGTGPMTARRVNLGEAFNRNAGLTEANCDGDAGVLITEISTILDAHPNVSQVVLAVDAPLLAMPRANLPERSRVSIAGTMERRQAEIALSAGLAQDHTQWKRLCAIQPGAPLCSRVECLVRGLGERLEFGVYGDDANERPRKLIECFPGEALWSLGAQGHFGTMSVDDAAAYKKQLPDLDWQPWPEVIRAVHNAFFGFRQVLTHDRAAFDRWVGDLAPQLLGDPMIMHPDGHLARGGKPLDDMVESVMSFFVAVCFARGSAHIWTGNNAGDGHIIGPGI